MLTFLLSALLLLISTSLRVFITNKDGTGYALQEIAIGLPVDLTFVSLSIVIVLANIHPNFIQYHAHLIAAIIVISIVQLGCFYKPCREYMDELKFKEAWGLWIGNALITFLIFTFLLIKVVK